MSTLARPASGTDLTAECPRHAAPPHPGRRLALRARPGAQPRLPGSTTRAAAGACWTCSPATRPCRSATTTRASASRRSASRLLPAAVNKPSNSDLYSTQMAEFVDALARTVPAPLDRHMFFIEGGALAVENALKAAFDWKVRKNLAAGRGEIGHQVIHFEQAFHGRSGYTLSLTNTDPRKTDLFPKFDWPRVTNPKLSFPLTPERPGRGRGGGAASRSPRSSAALAQHAARDRRADHRADPGRGRRQPLPRASSSPSCAGSPTRTSSCSSSTRSRPASAPPARWWCFEHFDVAARHLRLRQEDPGLRHLRRAAARRGRVGLPALQPHQLDLGRQPGRHGALPARRRDHRGGDPARQRPPGRPAAGGRLRASGRALRRPGLQRRAAAACSWRSTCPTGETRAPVLQPDARGRRPGAALGRPRDPLPPGPESERGGGRRGPRPHRQALEAAL